jgi:hypothetical protein
MLINGIFINTVIGYDLKSPIIPSSLIIFLMHWVAVKFLHSCNLYLMTSAGALKASWASVLAAPIIIVDYILNSWFLNFNNSLSFSYTINCALWAGIHPEATTFAPFQNLRSPSSLYKILAVFLNVNYLEPLTWRWVFRVSIG